MKYLYFVILFFFSFFVQAQKPEPITVSVVSEEGLQLAIEMDAFPTSDDQFIFKVKEMIITGLYPTGGYRSSYRLGDLGKYGVVFPVSCSNCYFKLKGEIFYKGYRPFLNPYVTVNSNNSVTVELAQALKEATTGAEWRKEAYVSTPSLKAFDFEGTQIRQIFDAVEKHRIEKEKEKQKEDLLSRIGRTNDKEEKINLLKEAKQYTDSQTEKEEIDQRIKNIQKEIREEEQEKRKENLLSRVDQTTDKEEKINLLKEAKQYTDSPTEKEEFGQKVTNLQKEIKEEAKNSTSTTSKNESYGSYSNSAGGNASSENQNGQGTYLNSNSNTRNTPGLENRNATGQNPDSASLRNENSRSNQHNTNYNSQVDARNQQIINHANATIEREKARSQQYMKEVYRSASTTLSALAEYKRDKKERIERAEREQREWEIKYKELIRQLKAVGNQRLREMDNFWSGLKSSVNQDQNVSLLSNPESISVKDFGKTLYLIPVQIRFEYPLDNGDRVYDVRDVSDVAAIELDFPKHVSSLAINEFTSDFLEDIDSQIKTRIAEEMGYNKEGEQLILTSFNEAALMDFISNYINSFSSPNIEKDKYPSSPIRNFNAELIAAFGEYYDPYLLSAKELNFDDFLQVMTVKLDRLYNSKVRKTNESYASLIEAANYFYNKSIEIDPSREGEVKKVFHPYEERQKKIVKITEEYGGSLAHVYNNGGVDAVKQLLDLGYSFDVRVEGYHPVSMAVVSNKPEILRLLLENNPNGIHEKLNIKQLIKDYPEEEGLDNHLNGNLVIMASGLFGSPEIVETLIEFGASVNVKDKNGMTPLHWAAANGDQPRISKILIDNGAEINATETLHARTPLVMAIGNSSNYEITEYLLRAGANIDIVSYDSGAYRDALYYVRGIKDRKQRKKIKKLVKQYR